jgi:hypothetical protein
MKFFKRDNGTDQNKTQAQPQVEPIPEAKNSNKMLGKGALLSIIILVLILGAALFMLNDQRQQNSQRSTTIESLEKQVQTLKGLNTSDGADTKEATAKTCLGGSNYKAAIGKFTVKVDSPRVIIRNLDAAFEGGPITSLEIGTCLTDQNRVVDVYPSSEAKITGHPAMSSEELKSNYEEINGQPLTAAGTQVIAGVTAKKYTGDGLFNATILYFDKGGIGYEVQIVDTNSTTEAILDDIISDWVFNS